MYLLLYIGAIMTVYIVTFKDDFTKEHVDKVTAFLVVIMSVIILVGIIGSVLGR